MITKLLNEINEKIETLNNLIQDKEYFEKLDERIEKVNNYVQKQKQKIERLNKALLDIKEILKKQSSSLDWEPWSTYQVSGQKLFDIAVILDKVLGSDK